MNESRLESISCWYYLSGTDSVIQWLSEVNKGVVFCADGWRWGINTKTWLQVQGEKLRCGTVCFYLLRFLLKVEACVVQSMAERLDFGGFESVGVHLILKTDGCVLVYEHKKRSPVRRNGRNSAELGQLGRTDVFLDPKNSRPQGWCVPVKYQLLRETNSSSNEVFECVIHSNTQIFIAVLVKAGRISAASRSRARPCSGAKGWCERTHNLFHHISTQVDQFKQVLWSRHSGTKIRSLIIPEVDYLPSAMRNALHYCAAPKNPTN